MMGWVETEVMLGRIGVVGLFGVVFMVVGIVLVALIEPIIALGLALVVGGIGMLTYGMISGFMRAMGGMMGPPPEPGEPP